MIGLCWSLERLWGERPGRRLTDVMVTFLEVPDEVSKGMIVFWITHVEFKGLIRMMGP